MPVGAGVMTTAACLDSGPGTADSLKLNPPCDTRCLHHRKTGQVSAKKPGVPPPDNVLPLFWAELETPFFATSPPFSTNRREAILSNLEHFPFSFMLHFLMFPDLLLCLCFASRCIPFPFQDVRLCSLMFPLFPCLLHLSCSCPYLCVRNDCPVYAFFFVFPFISFFDPHSFITTSYVPIYSYFSSLTTYVYTRYSAH